MTYISLDKLIPSKGYHFVTAGGFSALYDPDDYTVEALPAS
jgi:hypothetical protein